MTPILAISDAAVYAILAAIPTTLAGIGTLYLVIKGNAKTDAVDKKTDAVVEKTDTLIKDTKEIHLATNSTLDKMKAELKLSNDHLKVSNDQNAALQVMVTQLMKAIAPVSAAVVKNGTEPPFPPVTDAAVDKIVKAVEARTAAPAAPTAVPPTAEPVETLTIKGHEMAEIQIKKGTPE